MKESDMPVHYLVEKIDLESAQAWLPEAQLHDGHPLVQLFARHRLATSERAAVNLLKRALLHMVDQADRGQRPGGGSSVPNWIRDIVRSLQ